MTINCQSAYNKTRGNDILGKSQKSSFLSCPNTKRVGGLMPDYCGKRTFFLSSKNMLGP